MENNLDSKWISIHIYFPPPFEPLLIECILPTMTLLNNKGLLKKWFYIRYGKGGPHIRLRVLLHKPANNNSVFEFLCQRILSYLSTGPTIYRLPVDKCIVLERYEPELTRYGGTNGIKIAEDLFELSSSSILQTILVSDNWNYEDVMVNSIQFNYIMIYEIFLNKSALLCFMNYYFHRWNLFAYNKGILNYEYECAKLSHLVQPVLNDLHQKLLEESALKPSLTNWQNNIKKILPRLRIMLNYNEDQNSNSKPFTEVCKILDSYVHMNNNRIGLKNEHESLCMYFLIKLYQDGIGAVSGGNK